MIYINIILIGMPCSGKSTIGKIISKKLKMNFLDTDKEIVKKYSMSIEYIFSEKGEEYFRKIEEELINKISTVDNYVISTGGGVPIYNNNLSKLKKMGKTVFLNLPLNILIGRAKIKKNNRPIIGEDAKKSVKKLYNERINIYNKADIIINCDEFKNKEKISSAIINYIFQNKKE